MIARQKEYNSKANIAWYQIITIGVVFFIFFLLVSVRIFGKLFLLRDYFFGKLEAICGCVNHLSFTHHPYLFSFLVFLCFGVLVFAVFALKKSLGLWFRTRKYVSRYRKYQKKEISRRLRQVATQAGAEKNVSEISSNNPVIFCAGLLRPKIFVTEGFIRRVSDDELKAAILHEKFHARSFDPLKIFMIQHVLKILFFLPGTKLFARQYSIYSEIAADEYATGVMGSRKHIASALCKAIEWEKGAAKNTAGIVPYFSAEVLKERVQKLSDDNYRPRFFIFSLTLSLGIAVFISLFSFINIVFSSTSPILNSHDSVLCAQMQNGDSVQCSVVLDDPVCAMEAEMSAGECADSV